MNRPGPRCRLNLVVGLILLWVCLAIPPPLTAASESAPVEVTADGEPFLGGHLELLEDKEKHLTITEVAGPAWAGRFKAVPEAVPNLGLSTSAFWVRFRVLNRTTSSLRMHLSFHYPVTDAVSLFIPRSDGGYTRLDAGDSAPASPELVPSQDFVFPVEVPPDRVTTYHLRVETTAAMMLKIRLRPPRMFYEADRRIQMISGLLYGAVFGFLLYFLGMSLKLRNPSCFWFACYILTFGLLVTMRQGHFQEWLGSGFLAWNNLSLLAVQGGLYFAGAKLLRTFLNIQKYSWRLDMTLRVLQWMAIPYVPLMYFPNVFSGPYSLILVGVGPIFSTVVSMVYWYKGVPNAKYFAVGWLVGHATSTLDVLRIAGVIPYQSFMDYALPVSLVATLIFFSLAIVDQTYTFQFWARQDGLTGLANRRQLDQHLENEWNRHLRHQRPLALVMVDVDFFKEYNDHHGHGPGDQCLQGLAQVLQRFSRRPGELAARYGGEEFILLLPETPAAAAEDVAEKIRAAIEALGLKHDGSRVSAVVTASLGVAAAVPTPGQDPYYLLKVVDKALYQAKNQGRNRVAVAEMAC